MKQLHAILCATENRESGFHRCGGPVRLVQALLYAGKTDNTVLTTERVL